MLCSSIRGIDVAFEVAPGGLWRDAWYRLRRKMGMLFQKNALFDSLTVGNNIAFPLRVRKLPEPEIRRKVGRTDARSGEHEAAISD